MRNALLAIDVGGSTSRAYLVDETGQCLGHGRNRGGNPASNTPELAANAIIAAVEAAVADAGGGPFDIKVAQIALAGPQAHAEAVVLEPRLLVFGEKEGGNVFGHRSILSAAIAARLPSTTAGRFKRRKSPQPPPPW